ncbi:MAG: HAD-IA family hydrolase [Verrucomicrobiota bacterium]|nr:HAD-IA family hydrolase [Verrucomicrobiota bacterium]
MRYQAILFDLDGTLIDSVGDIAHSVNHVRTQLGKAALPIERVRSYVGDGVQLLMRRALESDDETLINQAITLWRPHYAENCLKETVMYSGIPEMLSSLHSHGIPMAVVSNKPEGPCRIILEGLNIAHLFKSVVGGDTTKERKPHPAPFLLALNQMNLTPNKTILVVGDSINDIEGARVAGLASCSVLWGLGPEEIMHTAQHVAEVPSDVVNLMSPV